VRKLIASTFSGMLVLCAFDANAQFEEALARRILRDRSEIQPSEIQKQLELARRDFNRLIDETEQSLKRSLIEPLHEEQVPSELKDGLVELKQLYAVIDRYRAAAAAEVADNDNSTGLRLQELALRLELMDRVELMDVDKIAMWLDKLARVDPRASPRRRRPGPFAL
jgi:hypothetical protein